MKMIFPNQKDACVASTMGLDTDDLISLYRMVTDETPDRIRCKSNREKIPKRNQKSEYGRIVHSMFDVTVFLQKTFSLDADCLN